MPADPNGPRTVVTFIRGGIEVARSEVPGHLLEVNLPKSVELRRLSEGRVQLVEAEDPLLECCGEVQLPWVSRAGPGLSTLFVPPPSPFDQEDLKTMWQARNRLVARRRPPTSGDAEWSRLRRLVGDDVDWSALQDAVTSAAVLLSSWPTVLIASVNWLPVDRQGGRLLVSVTERSTRSHRLPGGDRSPAVTARRSTLSQDRALHALSAVAALLASRVDRVPGLDREPVMHDRLVGLFQHVAQRSQPKRPVGDPPPSAWPFVLASAYSNFLRALSAIRDLGPGGQKAPLSELWELYQVWVAETVRSALESELGSSALTDWRDTCIGRWRDDGAEVELHYQPKVPTSDGLRVLDRRYIAAVGELQPDLLLVRADSSEVRAIVLDAKKRSAEVVGDDLTTNASKYLWGIRSVIEPGRVPAIEGAVLVAPLGGEPSALPEGRADVVRAHPSRGLVTEVAPALLELLRGSLPPEPGWHAPWNRMRGSGQ